MSDFNPYHKWLGIPLKEQPVNYYRLLGIPLFEDDPDVIENAADRQMLMVKTFQGGPHSTISQRILNEISAAKVCLSNAEKKSKYDTKIRNRSINEISAVKTTPINLKGEPVEDPTNLTWWICGGAATFVVCLLVYMAIASSYSPVVAQTEPEPVRPVVQAVKPAPVPVVVKQVETPVKPQLAPEPPITLPKADPKPIPVVEPPKVEVKEEIIVEEDNIFEEVVELPKPKPRPQLTFPVQQKVEPETINEENLFKMYLADIEPFEFTVLSDLLDHGPQSLNKKAYLKSFWAHPLASGSSSIKYKVEEDYIKLSGAVGLADTSTGSSPLIFKILGDNGKVLWQSQPVTNKHNLQPFNVVIKNESMIELFVQVSGSNHLSHATWVDPKISVRMDPKEAKKLKLQQDATEKYSSKAVGLYEYTINKKKSLYNINIKSNGTVTFNSREIGRWSIEGNQLAIAFNEENLGVVNLTFKSEDVLMGQSNSQKFLLKRIKKAK